MRNIYIYILYNKDGVLYKYVVVSNCNSIGKGEVLSNSRHPSTAQNGEQYIYTVEPQ